MEFCSKASTTHSDVVSRTLYFENWRNKTNRWTVWLADWLVWSTELISRDWKMIERFQPNTWQCLGLYMPLYERLFQ